MCGGVKFQYKGEDFTIYFPNPKAVLPVRLKSGEVELVPCGEGVRSNPANYLKLAGLSMTPSKLVSGITIFLNL